MKSMRILIAALAACAVVSTTLAQQVMTPYVVFKNGQRVEGRQIRSNGGILTFTRMDGQVQQIQRGEYIEAGGGPKPEDLTKGEQALKNKNYDEAIKLFQAVSRANRGLNWDITASLGMAEAQIAGGDAAAAVRTYEALTSANPNLKNRSDVAWGQRAALLAAKQYGPLMRQLDAVASEGSRGDAARAQNMRGDIQLAQNNVKAAAKDYLKTVILFEDVTDQDIQGEAHYKAAEALTVLRDGRAKEMYRKVVEKYPQSRYASLARGKM